MAKVSTPWYCRTSDSMILSAFLMVKGCAVEEGGGESNSSVEVNVCCLPVAPGRVCPLFETLIQTASSAASII